MKAKKISKRIYCIVGVSISVIMLFQIIAYNSITKSIDYHRELNSSYAVKQLNYSLISKTTILKKFASVISEKNLARNILLTPLESFSSNREALSSPITDLSNYSDDVLYFAAFSQENNYKLSNHLTQQDFSALITSYEKYCLTENYKLTYTFDFFTVENNPYDELYIVCFSPVYSYDSSSTEKELIGTTAILCKINLKKMVLSEQAIQDMEIQLYNRSQEIYLPIISNSSGNQYVSDTITLPISETGWSIHGTLYQSASEYQLVQSEKYILTDVFVIILMFLFLYFEFRRSVSVPLNKLTHYMTDYDIMKTSSKLVINSNTEFDFIAQQVNEMLTKNKEISDRILHMQEKLYEMELDQLKLELQSLQSQINPHFLYNTLECIRSIATVYHVSEIENVSYSLSQIMRYATKGNTVVSLEQELHMLNSYMEIMQVRFPDYYRLLMDIPEEYINCTIPKMTLQPLVENIFKYAHSSTSKSLTIQIKVTQVGHDLKIVVYDNGRGISADRLQEIRQSLKHNSSNDQDHVGLRNVHCRIRLHCGEKYGLMIDSKENEFTSVTLLLPFQS